MKAFHLLLALMMLVTGSINTSEHARPLSSPPSIHWCCLASASALREALCFCGPADRMHHLSKKEYFAVQMQPMRPCCNKCRVQDIATRQMPTRWWAAEPIEPMQRTSGTDLHSWS